MPCCSVRGCTNKSGHLFPKNNPTLKRKWLKFAGLTEKHINIHSLICKIHFAEDAFEQHEPVPGLLRPRKRLVNNAVPTLFPNLLEVQPMITPHKKPTRPAVIFNSPAPTRANKILLSEVDLSRAPVFSENQLVRVIERIKEKLKTNAHPSAVFPRKWKNSSLFAGNLKIREGYPPFSMPCLVAMAIETNPNRRATPPQIVGFISKNFPCYKLGDTVWHAKVFETLEFYKLFQKFPSGKCDTPKRTCFAFVPDRRTIMPPEVYEAFTDPFFDDSKISSLSHADLLSSVDAPSEDHDEFNSDLELQTSDDMPEVSTADDSAKMSESPDSYDRVRLADDGIDQDDESLLTSNDRDVNASDDSSTDEVTFLECSFCEFLAVSTKTISNHVHLKHWTGQNFCCSKCSYETPDEENLISHKATHKQC